MQAKQNINKHLPLLFSCLLLMSFIAYSAPPKALQVEVMALFKDKAMVSLDNKQHLLKVGEATDLGVKLIQATSKYAILEIDGKQSKYLLGNRVSTSYKVQQKKQTQIFRDQQGFFKTTGTINGSSVEFLVDTGASAIAINSLLARRLGIQYKLDGKTTQVSTASGVVPAYSVKLKRVKVGDITLNNVAALIIEGNDPSIPLLGMSYLGQLNIINEGQVMTLEQKF